MELQDTLIDEITASHSKAIGMVDQARAGVEEAINANTYTATLIEKASRMHKHDLAEFLAPVMSGKDVKRYMSIYRISNKREFIDKRQLQLIGIIDTQEEVSPSEFKPIAIKSMGTILGRFKLEIDKKIKSRPVCQWSEAEKDNFKTFIEPYTKILNEI